MVLCYFNWDNSKTFLICFTPLVFLWLLLLPLSFTITSSGAQILAELQQGKTTLLFSYLSTVYVLAAGAAQTVELMHSEIRRDRSLARIEEQLLLTESSYQHMKSEHTKSMVLYHDMMKHFLFLQHITTDPQTAEYLEDLIGETAEIRPIISCGNINLDIILNAKLSTLETPKVTLNLVRTSAPPLLPLSEREISSVFINILDNALASIKRYQGDSPYLTLDLAMKNDFFVFSCENSSLPKQENSPSYGRGLGLIIVHRLIERHGGTVSTTQTDHTFTLQLAIPLATQSPEGDSATQPIP